jgi:demethylmenaquinone methyltransferase/2-methoxy-6-polyprenyl-1,4-benzoquinol methylase
MQDVASAFRPCCWPRLWGLWDISPVSICPLRSLVCAKDIAKKAGLSERISFREGDINKLPFDDATFDWAWSEDCVGYAPIEPLPLVKALARVVKPGGSVIILAWSCEKLLPGHPLLEARLNFGCTVPIHATVPRGDQEFVYHRGLAVFGAAGNAQDERRVCRHR